MIFVEDHLSPPSWEALKHHGTRLQSHGVHCWKEWGAQNCQMETGTTIKKVAASSIHGMDNDFAVQMSSKTLAEYAVVFYNSTCLFASWPPPYPCFFSPLPGHVGFPEVYQCAPTAWRPDTEDDGESHAMLGGWFGSKEAVLLGSSPWQMDTNGGFMTGWWFQTFSIFHNIWDNPSHWLVFFKMVKTTNQMMSNRLTQEE